MRHSLNPEAGEELDDQRVRGNNRLYLYARHIDLRSSSPERCYESPIPVSK